MTTKLLKTLDTVTVKQEHIASADIKIPIATDLSDQ